MSYIGTAPTIGNFQICDAISVVNGQASYTMQVSGVNATPQSANHMLVSLNGILQAPNSSFTVSGSTITFASNLVTGDVIDFIQILGDVLDLGVPSDNTVSLAKLTATGTKDATTFLRGDNTFAEAGGGLIDTKIATFQGTQTHTGNTHTQVTDLSITHTASNSANKIILLAHIGAVQTISGGALSGTTAFSFAVDGSRPSGLIGTPASNRPGVTVRNGARGVNTDHSPGGLGFNGVYSPGDTSSHTYTVQVFCQTGETAYINHVYADGDTNQSYGSRAISTLMLMEVSV